MGKIEKAGIAIISQWEEGSCVEMENGEPWGEVIGLHQLVQDVSGVESPHASVLWDLESTAQGKRYRTSGSGERLARYRQESGREYPPVYRIRVVVEAEVVSQEETAAFWEQWLARWKSYYANLEEGE